MIAAYLAAERGSDLMAVRVAGPNAGHTSIGSCPPGCQEAHAGWTDGQGHPWRLRQVPVAAVSNPHATLAIAQGSEIDPEVLGNEVAALDAAGYDVSARLLVDPTATVLSQAYADFEAGNVTIDSGSGLLSVTAGPSLTERIGSTGKGIGAARAARALRQARLAADLDSLPGYQVPVAQSIREWLAGGGSVQIEGTQGYLLGQHTGTYPYCTSSDCTAMDFLAMAGIPPWLVPAEELEVWVVFRTYPIRVAGNSGPLAGETSWDELGLPPEYTTVTRKVRRVGCWQPELARQAALANGHRPGSVTVRAALTMADYLLPPLAGVADAAELEADDADHLWQLVADRSKDLGTLIRLVGTGPSSVIDLREAAARHDFNRGIRYDSQMGFR
jgi:adenylosuccinate synthase